MSAQKSLVFFAALMLVFIYAILVFATLFTVEGQSPEQLLFNFLILSGGFAFALLGAGLRIFRVLRDYSKDLHDIDPADASQLVMHLIFGLPPTVVPGTGPRQATLRVQAGKEDINGPPVVHKVGGPGKLAVDHNNAVVTSRLGLLRRVLGPGFYDLAPFERVWSVIDLRPQRRTVTVDFMTRDGIPAKCQASIVCRVAGPPSSLANEDTASPIMPYGFSEDKILQVATAQVVRRLEGSDRVSDWVVGMSIGALDGEVRDVLELYRLDDLLDPREVANVADGSASPQPRRFIPDLERTIQRAVRRIGRDRGIVVERVELGAVRPAEATVSEQWLAFWQAKLQRDLDEHRAMVGGDLAEKAEHVHVDAQIEFVQHMFDEVQRLSAEGTQIPPQLILAGFMEVLNSMYDHGPQMQQLLLWQAQNLLAAIDTLHRDKTMFARLPHPVGYLLPPQN